MNSQNSNQPSADPAADVKAAPATTAQTEPASTAPSSNLSMADLGAMLSKSSRQRPTPSPQPKPESAADTQAAPPPEENEQAPGEQAAVDPTASVAEAPAETSQDDTPTADDSVLLGELDGSPAAPAADDTAPASKLPPEVQEAIEEAKLGKSPARMVGRINELVRQREAERAARVEAERKLAQAQAKPPTPQQPASTEPYGWHSDVAPIDQELATTERALAWLDDNPDGGVLNVDGKEVEVTPEQARAHRRDLNRKFSALAGRREAKVAQIQAWESTVRQAAFRESLERLPAMHKPGTPEAKIAQNVLATSPGIKARPDWPMIVARYVAGQMALDRAAAANGKPKPAAKRPTPVLTQASAPPRGNVQAKAVQEAEEEFRKEGSTASLAKLLTTRRQARTAA